MRHIMVMNAKGGCGKSTLATNIATYYADQEQVVALADYDRQCSCLDWLDQRPDYLDSIVGVAAFDSGLRQVPRNADVVVMDAPARTHGRELSDLIRRAETIIVPVLPSSIDIKATHRFVDELRQVSKVERREVRIGVVANRVKENTLIFGDLEDYLRKLKLPYIGKLREAQNYVRAYTRGMGIFELPEYLAWPDWAQWGSITSWLDSRRSRP